MASNTVPSSNGPDTTFSHNRGDKLCWAYTRDKTLIRNLDKLLQQGAPGLSCLSADKSGAKEYVFPRSWLKIKPPRELTEEQRAELRERAIRNLTKHKSTTAPTTAQTE